MGVGELTALALFYCGRGCSPRGGCAHSHACTSGACLYASVTLASFELRLVASSSLLVQPVGDAPARPRGAGVPERAEVLAEALGEGRFEEVVRRLPHAAPLPRLRSLLLT